MLYRDYKALISEIAVERIRILKKKNSGELKELMDSTETIVKAFLDHASKNELSAFDTAHFFASRYNLRSPIS